MKVSELMRSSPAAANRLAKIAAVIPPEQAPAIFIFLDRVTLRITSLAWIKLSI